LAGLSDDEVAKIARGNAIRMLGLEPELSIVEEGSNA
jgi:hypothetical protein